MSDAAPHSDAIAGSHDNHGHPEHLAHHFDSTSQQIDSAKLGMWVFLSTELLMFGGLFCAYAIYRWNHSDVFLYAHRFLDTTMGTVNTVILLTSSMTMAWAVRAAMLGQKRLLNLLLILTLLGGCGFLVVKYFEYSSKFNSGLYPGAHNVYYPVDKANDELGLAGNDAISDDDKKYHIYNIENYYLGKFGVHHDVPQEYRKPEFGYHKPHGPAHDVAHSTHTSGEEYADAPVDEAAADSQASDMPPVERTTINVAVSGPTGIRQSVLQSGADGLGSEHSGAPHVLTFNNLPPGEQARVHIFYQIYYMMTGLHVLHVLIGMGLIFWVYLKALKGTFSAKYYTPVDIVGLYWHLVDLIWIFLFPLLYLIH